jgi:hypothetical protein
MGSAKTPLRTEEIEALGTTASDLIVDRDEGVAYPTETARQSADAFARALREEPLATLRAFQLALRRVQLDLREQEGVS